MTHNAGGSISSAEPCPWGHCLCGARQSTGIELNPCDFCEDSLRLFFLEGSGNRVRVQHGNNPEHSYEYGPEFGATEGYLPFITSIHEREWRAQAWPLRNN